jgi:hypothetical protein
MGVGPVAFVLGGIILVTVMSTSCGAFCCLFMMPGSGRGGKALPPRERPPGFGQAHQRHPIGFASQEARAGWWDKSAEEKRWFDQLGQTRELYLSDIPERERQMGPWVFGKGGLLGDPEKRKIQVQGRPSPKGLSTHPGDGSAASVRYELAGSVHAFRTAVALNDTADNAAGDGVQFEILGDGNTLAISKVIERKGDYDVCYLDVSRVHTLELRVYAVGAHVGCHAVWLEPRILQRKE